MSEITGKVTCTLTLSRITHIFKVDPIINMLNPGSNYTKTVLFVMILVLDDMVQVKPFSASFINIQGGCREHTHAHASLS